MKKVEDYVSLHMHSDLSQLDGLGKISEYAEVAAKRGAPALGLCDHGSMRGFVSQHESCEKLGLKPVYGCEFYISQNMTQKGLTDEQKKSITKDILRRDHKAAITEAEAEMGIRDRWHITVWAHNNKGLRNLMRLTSAAWVEGFYYKPRIDLDALCEHGEGLMVASGCLASPIHEQWRAGKKKKAIAYSDRLYETFGDRYWLEVMPHSIPIQRDANELALKLRERYYGDVRLLATQDAHYVKEGQAQAHDCLLCIGTLSHKDDAKRFRFDGEEYFFKSRKQMHRSFELSHEYMAGVDIKEALDSTVLLAERCDARVTIDYKKALLPDPGSPDEYDTPFDYLKALCLDGWTWRQIPKRLKTYATDNGITYKAALDVYRKRLKDELRELARQRFEKYFLIVHDIYRHARAQDILAGPGRGSAAGSLVAFLLGITSIDPIQHGLLFERFINPNRADLPDVDCDFEDRRRSELIQYMRDKYGHDHVAQIATIGKLTGKQCFRDVCRVMRVPLNEVNKLCPSIIERDSKDDNAFECVEDSFATQPKVFGELDEREPLVREYARELEGRAKTLGIHAAGLVVTPMPLRDVVPIETRNHAGERVPVTAVGMNDAAKLGLVKLDFLGLRTLSVISDCLKAVKERHGVELDLESADFDIHDERVLAAFTRHDYSGVFQYDSASSDKVCEGVSFDTFADVATMTALNRPGTTKSGMDQKFRDRKKNPELLKDHDFHPIVSEITSDTLGVLVYQEHLIKIFQRVGGMSPGDADSLRKAIGKKLNKKEIDKYRADFVDGAERVGFDEETANRLMDAIVFFSQYGFNKCLPGNTELWRADGTKLTVRELYDGQTAKTPWGQKIRAGRMRILAMQDDGRVRQDFVKAVYYNGREGVSEITTNTGRMIRATSNHKFLTTSGYRKVSSLVVGSQLIVSCDGRDQQYVKKGRSTTVEKIVSISNCASKHVFDVEMATDEHNFIANGFVSHNSHATAYGMIGYWCMYLKVYYPIEFFWALLKNEPTSEKIRSIARDAKRRGIKIAVPHVNTSKDAFSMDGDIIRGSLVDIKRVGDGAARELMGAAPFKSFVDFATRIDKRRVNRGAVEALIRAGAFGDMVNVRWMLENLDDVWKRFRARRLDIESLRVDLKASLTAPEFDAEELALTAADVNPLAFGAHPIDVYKSFIAREIRVPINTMKGDRYYNKHHEKGHWVCGIIKGVKKHQIGDFGDKDKDDFEFGKPYANVNIEDRTGTERRVKFAPSVYDASLGAIDAGLGKSILVHVEANAKYESIRAHFGVELGTIRTKLKTEEPLTLWEAIAIGEHPALVQEYKTRGIAKQIRTNERFFDESYNRFHGVVTHIQQHKDRNGNLMGQFGMLDAASNFIRVVCFASTWGAARKHLRPGGFYGIELQKERRGGYSFDGGTIRRMKES